MMKHKKIVIPSSNAFCRFSIREVLYFLFVRLPYYVLGGLRGNRVRVHWGRGLHNFGDCLQPYTLKHYGLTPYYVTSQEKSDVIMAGSILQDISPDYDGCIIGTGGGNMKYSFPIAEVLALRGAKSLENMDGVSSCVLGDAGLIMPYVFPTPEEKIYDLGIIPHFEDACNDKFSRLAGYQGVTMIDVLSAPPHCY